nr:immunoglobulin light chain junction region [Macaca mulatta]MOV77678.1 immunoglobulin light chain junction region [Macaca mulatta]MOV77819.1 immunoglobulin light chain junction region [Macaca mulatta]MOV78005.1 immunoglobulin light chain junction region [Macaca mulatta]MOV78086.1 immunoglobulin light chain junction region [Macaca mulatta]
CLQFKTYPNSF